MLKSVFIVVNIPLELLNPCGYGSIISSFGLHERPSATAGGLFLFLLHFLRHLLVKSKKVAHPR